jgi:GT2 family glycosyltransferase
VTPSADPLGGLAGELRERLGPAPVRDEWPLVSIVVLNRDGVAHLRRLLTGLVERTDYPRLELILVDNGSSDDSLDFIRSVEAPFPISIVANHFNESFSDANNQGAELAAGELLLFLNNDTEPFEPGWLRELVACLEASVAAAAGPVLLEPSEEPGARRGYAVQQRGLAVRNAEGVLGSAFRDRGADPLDVAGEDVAPLAVAAACLLIARDGFDAAGGFTHGYMYGPEDVDLALKLREAGGSVVCSGRSLLVHRMNSTLGSIERAQRSDWVRANRRLFYERWGPRVRREYELDRLKGGGLWALPGDAVPADSARRKQLEALGYCLVATEPRPELEALARELRKQGARCLVLTGEEAGDLRALEHDVAVYLKGPNRFIPKPAQLNVLWLVDPGDPVDPIERSRYDLVMTGNSSALISSLTQISLS